MSRSTQPFNNRTRTPAGIALVVLLAITGYAIFSAWQTIHQLSGPLGAEGAAQAIVRPFLIVAVVGAVILIQSLLQLRKKQFTAALVLAGGGATLLGIFLGLCRGGIITP